MKKMKYYLLLLIVFIVSSMSFLTACSAYSPNYQLSECEISISERNNVSNSINFNKKYKISECNIFFDTQLIDARLIDTWIDRIIVLSDILTEQEVEQVDNIYISDKLIANYWDGDNGEQNISYPLSISDEEVLAWILQAQFDSGDSLPYGIFAGVSAFWLKKNYSQFAFSSIEGADYLTELQFPLYESNNLPERQRTYAWNFSYNVVAEWVHSGKNEKELMSLNVRELSLYLIEKYNVFLPDYCFSPYSSEYEYLINQGCFTYYVNKEYNDLILPISRFNTSYNYLSDWLKDNSKTTDDSNELFGASSMYSINVFLDDGLKSTGITGEAYSNYIRIYSVGAFSHEYIHHILFQKGKSGYLYEVIPELHANNSKYAKMMWYYLFSGEATHFPYDKSVNEKKSYADALLLYNRKSAFEATFDNFNFWLFADCFSSLNTKIGQQFVSRLQSDSLHNYIAKVYGGEYVWQLNLNNNLMIAGKTYSEVSYEWVDYLNTIK